MIGALHKAARKARALLALAERSQGAVDELKLLVGALLSEAIAGKKGYASLADLEFKVFSQFGDDGIIQYLTRNLNLRHRSFVEFGVEDYLESNTRLLLQKDNWSGFVMDRSGDCIDRLRGAPFFWKHDLTARAAFVTKENVRQLLAEGTHGWTGLDLLHIDIDGNDYWIWQQIDLKPAIVIVEYNSTFGIDREITIPYVEDFDRTRSHFSNLYWGCSLKALYVLSSQKGYEFVGCNSAGNNAYFVRNDLMNKRVARISLEAGYVRSKYRESRDQKGKLTYLSAAERVDTIRGLPVFDIEQDRIISF